MRITLVETGSLKTPFLLKKFISERSSSHREAMNRNGTPKNARLRFAGIGLALVSLLLFAGCSQITHHQNQPNATKGVLDLSNWDFEKDGPVDLSGEYEFYWQQHVRPESFSQAEPPERSGFIKVPSYWKGYELNGMKLPGTGYATYRLTVLLKDSISKKLAFKFLDMGTAYAVFANGEKILAVGVAGTTPETTVPEYFPQIVDFVPDSNRIELIYLVSNFHHYRGGAWELIRLGTVEQVNKLQERRLALDLILFGSILVIGLYHLALFTIRRNALSSLLFGLLCLLVAVRLLTTVERFLLHVFPGMSWELFVKVEYLSFYPAVAVFVLFIYRLFSQDVSKSALAAIVAVSLLCSGIVCVTPPRIFTQTLFVYQVFIVLSVVYVLFTLVGCTIRKREGAALILIGFLFLSATIINDILDAVGYIQTGHFVHVGLFFFIFSHGFVLSSRYAKAFTTVKVQRAELEKANIQYRNEVMERKQAEEAVHKLNEELEQRVIERTAALQKGEEKYRFLVENTGAPIMFFNRKGELMFINQIGAQNFGSTPEALVGKSLQELFPNSQTNGFLSRIEHVIDSGVGEQFEDNAPFPPGRRWFWLNLQPIKNELSKPIGVQVISQDITERKEAEQELIKAKQIAEQSTRAKERFLAHMSHEIRTPINTVIGMVRLLQQTHPHPEQRECLQTLQSASDFLFGIINNILDLSKIEAGVIEFEKVEFKPAEILENVKQMFQYKVEEKNLVLLISLNDRIPEVLIGDPIRLKQILLNLVGNAVKFTETGVVIVNAELLAEDDHSANLSFSVNDTGIGIPEDKLGGIFDSFAQTGLEARRKYGGTGLGLTIAKQLVEMQGGSIIAESVLGQGSTFSFTLRFEKAATSPVQANQTTAMKEPAMRMDGLRVLLVDDDKLSQRIVASMLGKWGATVETADNGRVAIQKLAANSYDVVLMDAFMPEMNGFETASYIRNEMNDMINEIPILAMTAAASVKAREKVLAYGMNDYIIKPFEPRDLYMKIMRFANKPKVSINK